MIGRAKVELLSSPYAGGEPLAVCVEGRVGSSKVTLLLLPDAALSDMVFLRSFFSLFSVLRVGLSGSSGYVSNDDFVRPGNFTLDFFFAGFVTLISMVGAVVMISGAKWILVSLMSECGGGL